MTENSRSKVDKIVVLPLYKSGVKKLKKNHNKEALEKLSEIVDDLVNFKISTEHKNHMLVNTKGKMELHVDADILLIYRYDGDILYIELKLLAVTTHDKLQHTLKQLKNE